MVRWKASYGRNALCGPHQQLHLPAARWRSTHDPRSVPRVPVRRHRCDAPWARCHLAVPPEPALEPPLAYELRSRTRPDQGRMALPDARRPDRERLAFRTAEGWDLERPGGQCIQRVRVRANPDTRGT